MPAAELERLADALERPANPAQEYPPVRPLFNRRNWTLYLLADEFDWAIPPYAGPLSAWPQHAILDFRAIRLARARARAGRTLLASTIDAAKTIGKALRGGRL